MNGWMMVGLLAGWMLIVIGMVRNDSGMTMWMTRRGMMMMPKMEKRW